MVIWVSARRLAECNIYRVEGCVCMCLCCAMHLGQRVALNIQEIRRHRGVSQESLADYAGVSRGYFGKLENAKHSPTLYKIGQISMALEIDPLILFIPRSKTQIDLISIADNQGGYIDLSHS